MGGNFGEVDVDRMGVDGVGEGDDLRINGGDGGESGQVVLVGYE